jgi:hypothetical protein
VRRTARQGRVACRRRWSGDLLDFEIEDIERLHRRMLEEIGAASIHAS